MAEHVDEHFARLRQAADMLIEAECGQVTQELVAAGQELARALKPGVWPQVCEQRAFAEGAQWWHWHTTGSTMFASERMQAEDEAIKRYGNPTEQ